MSGGQYCSAYELYVSAGMYNEAHEIAIRFLAPDAILQHDFDGLKNLFMRFEGKAVDGWFTRGKVSHFYLMITLLG